MHNEELHDLHSSPRIVRAIKLRRMRRVGNVARIAVESNVYKVLVVETEGKRQLELLGLTGGDNIKMYLKETGLNRVVWVCLRVEV
jgi:hypothetical protein